ncbi:MAG: MltA domain-containing protein, partial [Pseudomonadota bacterium]
EIKSVGRPGTGSVKGGQVYQRLGNGIRRPYPSRAEITNSGVRPLAYAHPGDVFFLQIQGSGRLVLPDGRTLRAVYAANNGHPFKSTANWLMQRGWISRGEASMQGIRAWMDRNSPERVREAMNANPRFVFFDLEPEGDPNLGPKGSFGVPLTPLGSMAVDTSIHAGGVPMFVQTSAPGLGGAWSGLLVSQDTGGAIKGPVRGDLYFGTGPQAGAAADTVNAPGRLWVLLPRAVAERIRLQNAAQATASGPIVLTP